MALEGVEVSRGSTVVDGAEKETFYRDRVCTALFCLFGVEKIPFPPKPVVSRTVGEGTRGELNPKTKEKRKRGDWWKKILERKQNFKK